MKSDLDLPSPLMNAAGFLGFAPAPRLLDALPGSGAFVTNPLSLEPRSPANSRVCLPYSGGFLLHTGYPNPGFSSAVRRYASRWRRSPVPVWVSLLAGAPEGLARMARRLENLEGVRAVEIHLPAGAGADLVYQLLQAAAGELPVVLSISLDRAGGDMLELAHGAIQGGAAAISLAPPRGALPGPNETPVYGRLFGPAIFPAALAAVGNLVQTGIPVIGGGGVYHIEQARRMLSMGAIAVQCDAVLWRGEFHKEET